MTEVEQVQAATGCCTTVAETLEEGVLLKFDWLYYFVVLAECRNFTLAAQRLFISQQALSKAFAQLEKQLDATLLERRPWKLTAAGEQLLLEARRILERANRVEQAFLTRRAARLEGTLRLACQGYLEAGLLTTCRRLMQEQEGLKLKLLTELAADEVERQLLSHRLDLAVLPCQPRVKGLKSLFYASSPLVLVSAPGAFGCGQGHWRDYEYIACQAPEPLGRLLQWPEADYPRKVVAEADLQTALEMALAGQGVVWLPEHAVSRQLGEGSLYRLAGPPFQRRIVRYLVWASAYAHAPLLQHALQALRPD